MESTTALNPAGNYRSEIGATGSNEAHSSGVTWSAVIAGAFVTAALALILLALGTGVGLSSVSLWSNAGASASAIGASAIVWLIVMQLVSSSMGGYLAGRLRTKWTSIHSDEVYFRDTAHGFLSWAVSTVIAAAFLASAAAGLMGTAASSDGPKGVSTSQSEGRGFNPDDYFVDTLLRSDGSKPATGTDTTHSETSVILMKALKQGELPAPDKAYLDQLVAARTGLSQPEADQRVSEVFSNAKQAGEATRKAVAHSLLWAFVALLIGAFSSSLAATIGGRQRDHVVTL